MIPLNDLLKLKFPQVDFLTDIHLGQELGNKSIVIKQWNLKDVPKPSESELKQWENDLQSTYDNLTLTQINQPILKQLQAIDLASIRPLREGDKQKLKELDLQATQLRQQLKTSI
jgi:hypothetical protein